MQVQPGEDSVHWKGKAVTPQKMQTYILLHKPKGFVTTCADERGRSTVMNLIPKQFHVVPVGRLDMNTSGVLLLTTDGDLTFQLTHPKFQVEKCYVATLDKPFREKDARRLQSGIVIDGKNTAVHVKLFQRPMKDYKLQLCLHEGRKHIVKKILRTCGYKVLALKRTRFAGLSVRGLAPGEWRHLTQREIRTLQKRAATT